ncbi:hypothetical protein SAMN04487943_101523 [Gracilibacillus orientalis]|uniref:DUF1189 domain-containing protein n=1 Tax=Gracilibacillus orientalis TaxID=334253 RepID=A0A1I4HM86_9BACI|nr:DUF1189 family protein [Gracilibacillus orientalis]SFL43295.1 hypothetical protein SAMN04487943_101523 [Gracilibacillus orientalis]
MAILAILRKSAILPKKEALFWLNRVSMRDTLAYLFLLFFISFLPNVILIIANFEQDQSHISFSQFLLQIIIFYPFFMMFVVVTGISILAIGSWILKWSLQRKLAYQQLWKMTSFALLWPLILYHLLFFTPLPTSYAFLVGLMLLYILMYQMILIYPKKRK